MKSNLKLFLVSIVLLFSFAFISCSNTSNHKEVEGSNTVKGDYTCPMHPEVSGSKGDKCSKCGMNLVVK
ncbi:MAG TPA: heavy metal-binding domain-containing protein [Candidatus Kapabacteria bacterium]|nr:heavy metal-binding domain-containing protein [Candidatus Kapabacteria bacterium]